MSIAQHFVAGEGNVYPAHNEAASTHSDSAALAAFRCDPVNLPWVIFRAAFRATHIGQLPQRARAVLAALARTVDADHPFASIFASREILTGRAMQSMRTFYRSLDDLEAADLIVRRPQARYVEVGKFGRAYLHLTPRAATLLGFVDPPPVDAPVPDTVSAPAPSPAPSGQPADSTGLSFSGPSATVADGAIYKDLSPYAFQKRQPGQVPSDLQRLRSLGFIDLLIFKLMREARGQGKRLSDVVEATWEHLKLARAPINYLRALLQSPVDFGHQLCRRSDARAEAQDRLNRAARAELTAQQSAGQTFIDAHGQRKYVVDADGQSMMVYSVEEGVGRQAAGWKEQFAEARTRGHIRPASHEDLEAFAQARRAREAAMTQSTGAALPAEDKPTVTTQVRDHIAGLRDLLRTHRRALVASV
jgi:hypothetical protein